MIRVKLQAINWRFDSYLPNGELSGRRGGSIRAFRRGRDADPAARAFGS